MSATRRAGCARYCDALIALVDRGERGPLTDAALDHLDRCDRCTNELEAIAESIHALRGLGRCAALVEPSAEGWPRLESRIRRPGEPAWRWQMPLASLLATAAVVALLVGPGAVWRTRPVIMQEAGISSVVLSQQRAAAQRDEQSFIQNRALTAASIRAALAVATEVDASGTPPAPDGLAPQASRDTDATRSGTPPLPDGGRSTASLLDGLEAWTSGGGLTLPDDGQPSLGEDHSKTPTTPGPLTGADGSLQQMSAEERRR